MRPILSFSAWYVSISDKDDMALGNTKDYNLHVQVLCYPESYSNVSVDITLQWIICVFMRNKVKATDTAQ
jgi:hypothetical protein